MHHNVTDNLDALLALFPSSILKYFHELSVEPGDILEFVLDLGRIPEIRLQSKKDVALGDKEVTSAVLQSIVKKVGGFDDDNRAGIPRTLHRISAIRNRRGDVVGLTCRVGRAVYGVVDIIKDLVESGKSILLLGPPGVGKTTMLRESARVLADDLHKRVVIIDTSNEIAGDGDIPHQAIGRSRRMQVSAPSLQHKVMIEAVQNHMPEVIVIDEIGIEEEAFAARTIAERGVQLIGTAHGMTLENLMMNPTLVDLVGGIQTVTLSDEEAYRRHTQKSVRERMRPPTFACIVEITSWGNVRVHYDTMQSVDAFLAGKGVAVEARSHQEDGSWVAKKEVVGKVSTRKTKKSTGSFITEELEDTYFDSNYEEGMRPHIRIFPLGIRKKTLVTATNGSPISIEIVHDIEEADIVVTLKHLFKRRPTAIRKAESHGVPVYLLHEESPEEVVRVLGRIGVET